MKIPILLVNDNPDDQALILRAIERTALHIDIIVHTNCASALDWLHHVGQDHPIQPALIILDIATPQIDGVGFLQRLRADSQTRIIPVVIYSGSNDQQAVAACFACGCNSYIHKPIRYADFVDTVQHTIHYWLTVNSLVEY